MVTKQFAAIPFRIRDHEINVLLITTRRKRRWSVPKGWPIAKCEPRRTVEIEAYEEAGLIGKAGPTSVGFYRHRKQNGKRKIDCQVEVFPLEVRRCQKDWPERGQRDAIWISAKAAAKLVHKPQLKRLIKRFTRLKRRSALITKNSRHRTRPSICALAVALVS